MLAEVLSQVACLRRKIGEKDGGKEEERAGGRERCMSGLGEMGPGCLDFDPQHSH